LALVKISLDKRVETDTMSDTGGEQPEEEQLEQDEQEQEDQEPDADADAATAPTKKRKRKELKRPTPRTWEESFEALVEYKKNQ
jgi:hypothetical protein